MTAPLGNKFWLARSKHGRDKIFSDSSVMWKAACEYFEWVDANPLWESKVTQYQGQPIDMQLPRMRAMTLDGLWLFFGIGKSTWYDYKEKEGFAEVIEDIENVIRSQKFAGAAADLLNANIIARDLGLIDSQKVEHEGVSNINKVEIEIVGANAKD